MCSVISTKFQNNTDPYPLPVMIWSRALSTFLISLDYLRVGPFMGGRVERPVVGFGKWLGGG